MRSDMIFTYGTITVRAAGETESAEALAAFFKQAGKETDFLSFSEADCPYTPESCKGFLAECRKEGNLLLLAFESGALIGELSLTAPNRERFRHTRELGIAILKPCCDKGLGTAMLSAALHWADAAGVDSVFLTVSEENERGRHLYEKLGFTVYGRYPRQSFYNGAYHEAVYMARYRKAEEA